MGLDTSRQYRVPMGRLNTFTRLSLAALCVALSSCTMPSSGPSANKIQSGAKETYAPYTLINVNPNVVSALDQNLDQQLAVTLGNSRKRSSALIGVGDTVAISIWEASPDGLFSSGAGRGGGTQIPEQPVSEAGTISVPYAGVIQAANRTPDQVKEAVEKALIRMAVQPQVLVSVVKNVSNTVTVTGEVASSGRIPLSPRGEKLLDVIAIAGGPRMESHQLSVQITRGRRTETIPMERLISDPTENIYVQSDDVVALIRQPRSFTVFGASTANASVQFDESQLYPQPGACQGRRPERRTGQCQGCVHLSDGVDEAASPPDAGKGFFLLRPDSQRHLPGRSDRSERLLPVERVYAAQSRPDLYCEFVTCRSSRKFATLVSSTAAPIAQAASVSNTLSDLGK